MFQDWMLVQDDSGVIVQNNAAMHSGGIYIYLILLICYLRNILCWLFAFQHWLMQTPIQ